MLPFLTTMIAILQLANLIIDLNNKLPPPDDEPPDEEEGVNKTSSVSDTSAATNCTTEDSEIQTSDFPTDTCK